jgi:DNA polymerase-1
MIDYLALVGDSSDNVPGVRGVGPKTAQKLLSDYETLDGIYQNLDKLKGSVLTKLTEHKAEAYMSQKLVTIECDMKLNVDLEDLKLGALKTEELVQLLKELDFNSFAKQVEEGTATATKIKGKS